MSGRRSVEVRRIGDGRRGRGIPHRQPDLAPLWNPGTRTVETASEAVAAILVALTRSESLAVLPFCPSRTDRG
jgi:hypothetical protein